MESTTSVSRGYFAFPVTTKSKKSVKSPLDFSSEPWFNSYRNVWKKIANQLDEVEDGVIETLLQEMVKFISSTACDSQIPAAALLTGIDLPDHGSLFSRLKSRLYRDQVVSGVAILNSTDCVSIKHTIERCVAQLRETPLDSEEELDSDDEEERISDLKRNQCTLPNLSNWFENLNVGQSSPLKKKRMSSPSSEKKLVIVLRDFETFSPNILSTFIQILSGYISKLPFVLVFGIATNAAAVDQVLPHSCISRLHLKAFQAQPSVYFLNNTLNKVFLTPDCPFQLGGKLFKFFIQVFLFYDFSVNRFIQGIKYCVMEHYRIGGHAVGLLCCPEKDLVNNVDKLNHSDIEYVRRLPSFRNYVEVTSDKQKQIKLLSDDGFTKKQILKLMTELRQHIKEFHPTLILLHSLVSELPQFPLGKQLRELYTIAMCKDIWTTPEYKECKQLLGFLSKDDLIEKIKKMISSLNNNKGNSSTSTAMLDDLSTQLTTIENAGLSKVTRSPTKSPMKNVQMVKSRAQLKQKVYELGNKDRNKSAFEIARGEVLDYLMDHLFPSKLRPLNQVTLWEIVTLIESEARYRVVPRIRAPIHTALNNPAHYLMCDCCKISDNDEILQSMPDLCIAYKLHLESGALINMYDWLQSFNVLVTGQNSEDDDVDLKVQARFTQAVSEMEFLGFVKSSKKKADHVARLTWGGSTS